MSKNNLKCKVKNSKCGFMTAFAMLLALSLALAGCGGGSGKNPVTASSGASAASLSGKSVGALGLKAKAEVRGLVESLPFFDAVGGESVPALTKGKYLLPEGVSSVVRSGMTATREIMGSYVSGVTAYVSATFTLSGTLTFKDSAGSTVSEKPISLTAYGDYVLEKDTSGAWTVIEDAAENLTFSSGGSFTVEEVKFEPAFAGPGDTQKIEATISNPTNSELYITGKIGSLGLKSTLTDDGTGADFSAGDGIYTAEYTLPSTVAEGQYVGVLDIIDKTQSFDLTSASYTGQVLTHPMLVGNIQSLTLTSNLTTVTAGEYVYFLAEGVLGSGTTIDLTNDVTWTSSDTNVGDVYGPGYFYGFGSGTSSVSASLGTLTSNSIAVTVTGGAAGGGGTGVFGAPANVVALPSADGEVTLYWDFVADAVSYNVYMASQTGVSSTNYASLPDGMAHPVTYPYYVHTGLTNGTTYYFVVTAVDASGVESSASTEVDAMPSSSGGGIVGGVYAYPGDGSVSVYWDTIPGATSYSVYMASQTGVTSSNYSTLPAGNAASGIVDTFYTFTGLTNGTTYYFVVVGTDGTNVTPDSPETYATAGAGGGGGASYCGDAYCDASVGEDATTCAADCSGGGGTFGAPANVLVTGTMLDDVTLSWDYVTGAVSYNLYYATVPGVTAANYASLAGGTVTMGVYPPSFMVTGLTPATTYYFVLTAVDASSNESAESTEVYTTTGTPGVCGNNSCEISYGEDETTCPSDCTGGGGGGIIAPSNVTATPGNGQIALSWDPVASASTYHIYLASQSGVTAANYSTLPAGSYIFTTDSNPGYTLTGLANDVTFYIVVTAVDINGIESTESVEVSATPTAGGGISVPSNVTASPGNMEVTLSWDPAGTAYEYHIYYASVSGVTAANYTGLPDGGTLTVFETLTTTVTGLNNGTPYYFVVTAVDGTESAESAEVSETPQAGGISAPVNVMTTPGNGDVSLSWDPVAGAVSYNIYYASVSGVTAANYTGLPDGGMITTMMIGDLVSGLTNGTTYYFVVTAFDGTTESVESAEVGDTPTAGGNTVTKVAGGDLHSCALLSNNTVKCWGGNTNGQLGNGTDAQSLTPVNVTGLTFPSEIGLGFFHSCAVDSVGVKCWGNNTSGELGDGTNTPSNLPVSVSALTGAIGVDGGNIHTCAVRAAGDVMCWGGNLMGQLGDGTNTDSNVPVGVSGITMAISITTGAEHSCAVLSDNTVKCWGNNTSGALGDGTTTPSNIPVSVSGISTAVAVKAGEDFTCALLSDASVQCWGDNLYGQLGDGSNTPSLTPVAVSGLSGVTSLSAGGVHACAVMADGSSYCWGLNDMGELGDASYTNSNFPVAVFGVTYGDTAGLGNSHSCLVMTDGTVSCFGYNGSGGLGDGTVNNSNVPVSVDASMYVQMPRGKLQYFALRLGGAFQSLKLKVKEFMSL